MPAHPENPATVEVDLPSTGIGAKLDYANVPRAQQWRRRIGRWAIFATLVAAVGLAIKYRPLALRHWELLRLQRQCLDAELPKTLPIVEFDTEPAQKLLRAHPAEYTAIFACVV